MCLFFIYFRFWNILQNKNFKLLRDSSLHRQIRRQTRWPLDPHHGPKISFNRYIMGIIALSLFVHNIANGETI